MDGWMVSFSSEAILVGIFVILIFINDNISTLVREMKNKKSQPTEEQILKLIEQINHLKWHVDQIRQHVKYGESNEESELNAEAQWLKSFKE